MLPIEDYHKLQKKIVKYRKLEDEINQLTDTLGELIKSRDYIYNGEPCYPNYICYEGNFINLSPKKYIGTRLDYVTVKQLTFDEFFDTYFNDSDPKS